MVWVAVLLMAGLLTGCKKGGSQTDGGDEDGGADTGEGTGSMTRDESSDTGTSSYSDEIPSGDADSDTDTDTDIDGDVDSETGSETPTSTRADTESDTVAESETLSGPAMSTDSGSASETVAGTPGETESVSATGTGTDSQTDSEPDGGMDAGATDSETESDSATVSETASESTSDTAAETPSDSETASATGLSDPCAGNTCDNGLFCDGVETCDPNTGLCVPGVPACDDGVGCTTDSCAEGSGQAVCTHTSQNSLCDNGLLCDGVETCDLTQGCLSGTAHNCSDGVDCTEDTCTEGNGQPVCAHTPRNSLCQNGVNCDGEEICSPTLGCQAGTPETCDDGVGCTVDACDTANDVCTHVPDHGLCDDGLSCTGTETCDLVDGCLQGTPVVCDDGIPCTTNLCVEQSGGHTCAAVPDDSACDNGLFCDGEETCSATAGCQQGVPPVCTGDEFCSESHQDCVACESAADCDDGSFCNGQEVCDQNGDCQTGTPPSCDDGVDCTVDECNDVGGVCDHTPDHSYCEDANPTVCSDEAHCDAQEGCEYTPVCPGQVCDPSSGAAVCVDCMVTADCDDHVGCTEDACNSGTCINGPNDDNCPNNQICSPQDGCGCPSGFKLDGETCVDFDECDPQPGPCAGEQQYCINTEGSYTCNCEPGYRMEEGECVDINECEEEIPPPCDDVCTNTEPGYVCSCDGEFYTLMEDEHSCMFDPFTSTEMVGRPTDHTITLQTVTAAPVRVRFDYGTAEGEYPDSTVPILIADTDIERVDDGSYIVEDAIVEDTIHDLDPDTRYHYRLAYQDPAHSDRWYYREGHSFHTQRPVDHSGFVFTVQSDSHQHGFNFYDDALYAINMANQLGDGPDFMFDVGDTFAMDGNANGVITETVASSRDAYMNQRVFFDDLGHSVPAFLALGNHENEEGWNLDDFWDGGTDYGYERSLPVLGINARKRYFLNPIPDLAGVDLFYTGNEDRGEEHAAMGADLVQLQAALDGDDLKEDYFSFEWGNALFVVLDPFAYTMVRPFTGGPIAGELTEPVTGDRWDWTLGYRQYQWLKRTLEESSATFKFVFSHHVLGGTPENIDGYVRGGVEGAYFCEWGGYNFTRNDNTNAIGPWLFDERRPDFEMPVHQMMAANGVTLFFHGHDHQYAREELDGVAYVEIPHPAKLTQDSGFNYYQVDYDHPTGGVTQAVATNSGYIRVHVAQDEVFFEYVHNTTTSSTNGQVADSHTIEATDTSNAKPVAEPDQFTVEEGSENNVLAVLTQGTPDSDPDGDPLTVVGASQPLNGTVTPIEIGLPVVDYQHVIYTPTPGYCNDNGDPDTFSYIISDGRGRTASATVQVAVTCDIEDPDGGVVEP